MDLLYAIKPVESKKPIDWPSAGELLSYRAQVAIQIVNKEEVQCCSMYFVALVRSPAFDMRITTNTVREFSQMDDR